MNFDDLSTYVKKRAQRSDDSILLRHMDDVVGTGPEEHLMSDFEHMKTSLCLTNVVKESKRAVKQLIRYLKGTQHTCLLLEPREMVQTGLLELVFCCDSDWAGGSATRQSVTGYHCDVQNVTKCNRSLKQTAISLSCEAEFYAASACAGELLGLAELFKELASLQSFSSSRDGFRLRKTHSAAKGTRWTQTHRDTMLGNTTIITSKASIREPSGHEEQHSRSFHETS